MQQPTTSPLRDSIRPEAEVLLGWMKQLDAVMGTLMPTGNSVTVVGYAQGDVTESFFLARRTFGSTYHLMDRTARTVDTDRTEDAAILVRRLLDLLARCHFIVGENGDQERGNQDLRAARTVLSDVKQHLTALHAGLELANTAANSATTKEWEQAAADLEDEIVSAAGEPPNTHVSANSEERLCQAKPPPNTHDILKGISPLHALLWRQLSDVSHGGMMGRAYQRTDLTFGVPAEPTRQDTVMHTAVAVMADLCRRWLVIMDLQSGAFDDFSSDFEQFNAQPTG